MAAIIYEFRTRGNSPKAKHATTQVIFNSGKINMYFRN